MELIDMKRAKPKKSEENKEIASEYYDPYPYGLRITLNKEELEKLNIDVNKFDIGQRINIMAEAEVVNLQTSPNKKSGDQSIGFQLVKMNLTGAKTPKKSAFTEYSKQIDSKPVDRIPEG